VVHNGDNPFARDLAASYTRGAKLIGIKAMIVRRIGNQEK